MTRDEILVKIGAAIASAIVTIAMGVFLVLSMYEFDIHILQKEMAALAVGDQILYALIIFLMCWIFGGAATWWYTEEFFASKLDVYIGR